MTRALWEILWRTVAGRVVRGFRLIRRPRYLAGFLVGLLYFFWLFFRPFSGGGLLDLRLEALQMAGIDDGLDEFWREGILFLSAAGAALAVAVSWLFIPGRAPLKLNAAEIHYLLPAPISRRRIIQYSLYRSQVGIFVVAAIFAYLSQPSSPGGFFKIWAAFWIAFTLWDLHGKGRNLWKTRLRQRPPRGAAAARGIVTALAAVLFVLVGAKLASLGHVFWEAMSRLRAEGGEIDLEPVLTPLARNALESWIRYPLQPFALALRPLLGGGPAWAVWIPPLLLMLLHHEWVVRSQANFEDRAIELEKKRADSKTRKRVGVRWAGAGSRRRHPFPLRPVGPPAVAVLWKNLIGAPRLGPRQILFILFAVPVVSFGVTTAFGAARSVVIPQIILVAQLILLAPFLITISWPRSTAGDLRNNIEMIRTWPLAGWRLVAAQTMAPAVVAGLAVLLGVGWILGLETGIRSASPDGGSPLSGILSSSFVASSGLPEMVLLALAVLGVALVIVTICILFSSVQSLGALLFPGWVLMLHQSGAPTIGTGHGLLTGVIGLLVMVVALIPAAVLTGLVAAAHLAFGWPFPPWEVPLLLLLFIAPLLVEAYILVRIGGGVWERLDPSAEILES